MTALLLLDETFSPGIAAELRQLGHDILAVADLWVPIPTPPGDTHESRPRRGLLAAGGVPGG
jgi:hypothetical protein